MTTVDFLEILEARLCRLQSEGARAHYGHTAEARIAEIERLVGLVRNLCAVELGSGEENQ